MSLKKQIEELERRVKELEARPIVYPPVYIPQPYPVYPTWPPYYNPWYPGTPWYQAPTYVTTCGGGIGQTPLLSGSSNS